MRFRFYVFTRSPVGVGYIRLVLFIGRENWHDPLDKRPRTGRRTNGSQRENGYVLSVCVDTAMGISLVAEKRYRDAPGRCPVPESQISVYSNTRGLIYGFVGVDIVLVLLGVVVLRYARQRSPPVPHSSFTADRTSAVVHSFVFMMSTPLMLFAAVGTVSITIVTTH